MTLFVDYSFFFCSIFFSIIQSVFFSNDQFYVLYLKSIKSISLFFCFLKKSSLFRLSILFDIYALDFPSKLKRFLLIYGFQSTLFTLKLYVQLKVSIKQNIESVISLYSSSGWLEREIYDMFGIPFSNHPDLRRLLTDYGFQGFPLRKDFAQTGYYELLYSEITRTVLHTHLQLSQQADG